MAKLNLDLILPAFPAPRAKPDNVVAIDSRPRVLHAAFVRQLAEANRAVRQLRTLGCRVLSQTVSSDGARIVIDRNPHCRLTDCPRVSVTWGGRS